MNYKNEKMHLHQLNVNRRNELKQEINAAFLSSLFYRCTCVCVAQ